MRVKIELLSLFTVYLSINGRISYRNILLQGIQTEHEFWSVWFNHRTNVELWKVKVKTTSSYFDEHMTTK